MTANGWLQIGLYFLGILAVTPPLGRFMTRVFNREPTWLDPVLRPLERAIYRATRVDEARLLAEIHREIEGLAAQFAASEASVAPVRAAMDALYRRTLQAEVPADTYPARLR